ncbi:MAG: hypothetical protein JRM96_03460 [Nitrososphaerota archaeon]|jgi:lipopolysaccharide biosynthesis regulator YciM|nr:hypothetical protein [Nitrososphaerota archaeon]MDG6952487.1 hypothetical protein [Nitrososphaerota archaeon]
MENARRLTVSFDDETYVKLVDYAAELSKQKMGRFSLSEALRDLVARALEADARGSGQIPRTHGWDPHGR